MKCTNCQTENKDAAKFCRGCGGALAVLETVQQVQMKICTECQHACKPEAKFCLQCGHNFLSAIADPESPPVAIEPPEENSKTCPGCQNSCKPAAKFCLKCGHDFAVAFILSETEPVAVVAEQSAEIRMDENPIEETKLCPGCSNSLKLAAKFCGKCGFSFVAEEQTKSPERVESPVEVILAAPVFASEEHRTTGKAEVHSPKSEQENTSGEVVVPAEEINSCPSCSNQLKENAKFCGKCGFSFAAGSQPESPGKIEPVKVAALNQPATRSAPEISPQVAQHDAIRETKSGSKALLIGAVLASSFALSGGSYWWFKVRNVDFPVLPAAQTAIPPNVVVEPVSSVPVATIAPASSVPVVDVKKEAPSDVPPAVAAVKSSSGAAVSQSDVAKDVKKENKQVRAKNDAVEKLKHSSPTVVHEPTPHPVPPVPQPPVQDVKLDPQNESMLAMADKMYASKSYSAVLDLAKPVLKKYPGNPHATRLINNSHAAIDRQQDEILAKLKELSK